MMKVKGESGCQPRQQDYQRNQPLAAQFGTPVRGGVLVHFIRLNLVGFVLPTRTAPRPYLGVGGRHIQSPFRDPNAGAFR